MNRNSSGEVLHWPGSVDQAPLETARQLSGAENIMGIRSRLLGVLAILRAIDAGELLAALPDCEIASECQLTAIRLLHLAEQELTTLCDA